VETRRLLSSATIMVGEVTTVATTKTYQSSVETVISDIDIQLVAMINQSIGQSINQVIAQRHRVSNARYLKS